jgi:Putative MetA-pathway of phenol degradation
MSMDDFKKVSEMSSLNSLTTSPVSKALLRSAFVALLLFTLAETASAQINCGAGSTALACLVQVSLTPPPSSGGVTFSAATPLQPRASTTFSPNTLAFLSGDIGTEVSQIPLASPASGIIYTNNPVTQLPERLDQSFGPILTQRAQTIGRHNWYFATTYQYFLLQDIDSQALKNTGAVIYLNSSTNSSAFPDFAGVSNNFLQLKVHQFVGYITYGLASRVDVSVAVPLLRVDLRDTFSENFVHNPNSPCTTSCPPTPANQSGSRAGEATGIGDVVLAAKVNVWKLRRANKDHGGFSLGVEARLPSGDSHNFLGSGAIGAKPFATLSYAGRVSPHFNVGFQFNGKTNLITAVNSSSGTLQKGSLPNRLIYSGGVDFALLKKLTVNLDGIAQHVYDAQRATLLPAGTPLFSSGSSVSATIPVVQPVTGSYDRADAAGGLKLNPFKGFLITGNVSVKLNQAGLRSRVVPLVGASLTF